MTKSEDSCSTYTEPVDMKAGGFRPNILEARYYDWTGFHDHRATPVSRINEQISKNKAVTLGDMPLRYASPTVSRCTARGHS